MRRVKLERWAHLCSAVFTMVFWSVSSSSADQKTQSSKSWQFVIAQDSYTDFDPNLSRAGTLGDDASVERLKALQLSIESGWNQKPNHSPQSIHQFIESAQKSVREYFDFYRKSPNRKNLRIFVHPFAGNPFSNLFHSPALSLVGGSQDSFVFSDHSSAVKSHSSKTLDSLKGPLISSEPITLRGMVFEVVRRDGDYKLDFQAILQIQPQSISLPDIGRAPSQNLVVPPSGLELAIEWGDTKRLDLDEAILKLGKLKRVTIKNQSVYYQIQGLDTEIQSQRLREIASIQSLLKGEIE